MWDAVGKYTQTMLHEVTVGCNIGHRTSVIKSWIGRSLY